MSGETQIVVVGNLTGDPEIRFTPAGAAVANFTIASTPRTFDKATNEWKDGDTLFMRCSIWREAAENVAESLTKGMRVIAQGNLVQRSYETREGEKRTVVELQVEEVGPSLKYATAKVTRSTKVAKSSGGYDRHDTRNQATSSYGAGKAPTDDPWTTQPTPTGGADNDRAPF